MSAKKGWPVGLVLTMLVMLAACSPQSASENETALVDDETTSEQQVAPAEEEIENVEIDIPEEEAAEEASVEETAAEEEITGVQAAEGQCVSVNEPSTTIRRAPEAEGKVLGYLADGQGLQVLSIDNEEWFKVVPPEEFANFGDLWVWQGATESMPCSELDTFVADAVAQSESATAGQCATVTAGSLSIRTVPQAEGFELGFASRGEVFEVVQVDNEEWLRIVPPERYASFPDLWIWNGAVELAPCVDGA